MCTLYDSACKYVHMCETKVIQCLTLYIHVLMSKYIRICACMHSAHYIAIVYSLERNHRIECMIHACAVFMNVVSNLFHLYRFISSSSSSCSPDLSFTSASSDALCVATKVVQITLL